QNDREVCLVTTKREAAYTLCPYTTLFRSKTLVYSVYTGTRDTTSRLKVLLEQEGFKVAVLRASVDAARREDWIAEKLYRGIDVRSEEHTSELQSREQLVCRRLLENKIITF